jgi:hypothetical protein
MAREKFAVMCAPDPASGAFELRDDALQDGNAGDKVGGVDVLQHLRTHPVHRLVGGGNAPWTGPPRSPHTVMYLLDENYAEISARTGLSGEQTPQGFGRTVRCRAHDDVHALCRWDCHAA